VTGCCSKHLWQGAAAAKCTDQGLQNTPTTRRKFQECRCQVLLDVWLPGPWPGPRLLPETNLALTQTVKARTCKEPASNFSSG
jgi:hypothetical protein